MVYDRFLVARNSPQNECHSPDGELLYLQPPAKAPGSDAPYAFTGTRSAEKNRYGWVEVSTNGFTVEEFLDRIGRSAEGQLVEPQKLMLKSISRLPAGTPVAVDFFRRSIPTRVELVVHKVIFHI